MIFVEKNAVIFIRLKICYFKYCQNKLKPYQSVVLLICFQLTCLHCDCETNIINTNHVKYAN